MKETIKTIVYERFYKKLRKKFYNEFFPSNSQIPEDSKDVWKKTYKDLDTNIAKKLFEINNEFHFHRKYDEEAKQHLEYGYPLYPITISRKQFSLALKYLLFGRVEKIDEFPELYFDFKANWERNYSTLHDLFVEQEFPNGIEEKKDEKPEIVTLRDDDIESIFLSVVSNNKEIFYSPTVISIIHNFFESIASNSYIDSWHLLQPDYQLKSLWKGDFETFKLSFAHIRSIEDIEIIKITYDFKSITCQIRFDETGTITNLKGIYNKIASDYSSDLVSEKDMTEIESYLSSIFSKYFSPISKNEEGFDWHEKYNVHSIQFGEFLARLVINPYFQIIYFLSNKTYNKKWQEVSSTFERVPYNRKVRADIELCFIYGKWLICRINILPASRFSDRDYNPHSKTI
ncbi:hypothetical protein [Chitinophaga barathri]|uniref:Uncharacterized protein n=1 Tax=Chitinophaga barathri TaxID=1647451 RepID=A0A3N4MF55_9BACT|nr:hypothetical protein [Chitinophaga barathri]RPD40616.1 hypothetical protein EG028_15065 [Chitinophaga barathri]